MLRQSKESVLAKFVDYADSANRCCQLGDLKRGNIVAIKVPLLATGFLATLYIAKKERAA